MARPPDRSLEIYLADHLAAAAAGVALVSRAARNNTGTRTGDTLRRLAAEIDEDRLARRRLVDRSRLFDSKQGGCCCVTQQVRHRKQNVELRGYSHASSPARAPGAVGRHRRQAGALGDLAAGTGSPPASPGIRAAPLDRASSKAARRGGGTSPRGCSSGIRRRGRCGKVGSDVLTRPGSRFPSLHRSGRPVTARCRL